MIAKTSQLIVGDNARSGVSLTFSSIIGPTQGTFVPKNRPILTRFKASNYGS